MGTSGPASIVSESIASPFADRFRFGGGVCGAPDASSSKLKAYDTLGTAAEREEVAGEVADGLQELVSEYAGELGG